MLDFILTTVLFTLPEAILMTLGVIYLLKIRCTRLEKWIALGYTLVFLALCNFLPTVFAMHIPIILIGLALIFKAWCSYYVPLWRYISITFAILIGMLLCETIIGIPLVYLSGCDVSNLNNSPLVFALFSLPIRVVEFAILYIFNRGVVMLKKIGGFIKKLASKLVPASGFSIWYFYEPKAPKM